MKQRKNTVTHHILDDLHSNEFQSDELEDRKISSATLKNTVKDKINPSALDIEIKNSTLQGKYEMSEEQIIIDPSKLNIINGMK